MRILIAEDDPVSRCLLEKTLRKWGHQVVVAEDGLQAWEALQKEDIRLVVADWMMPGVNGLELCQKVRSTDLGGYVYLILLTIRSGRKDIVEGLVSGADDYVIKPFDPDELRARISTGERIISLERRLREAHKEMERLATTDGLTNLLNHRAAIARLEEEFARARREGHTLSCIMLDLDHFKLVNDAHGHRMGDEVLRQAASRMRSSCRPYDAVARYGGEEFLVVLPGASLEQAVHVACRIRQSLSGSPIEWEGTSVEVKASFGVAEMEDSPAGSTESLIIRADRALYRGKREGGDRVCTAQ